jgi:hypothetical protein
MIAKSLSLVVRIFQHSLEWDNIARVYTYLSDLQLASRNVQQEKLIKSVLIQIVRHVFENLREMEPSMLADGQQGWSLRKVCSDTLAFMVDEVVVREQA